MTVTINGTTGIAGVDGSAATPAVQGVDTNTGIFFPAADTIAFTDGGAEAMRINSSGNVGIGTTDTSIFNAVGGATRLAVCGSSASTNIAGNTGASISIINTDTTANNTAGLHFARADTDDTPNYAGASIVAQFPDTQVASQYPKGLLTFLTSTVANSAPSEKMRIESSGNLLVGTTTDPGGSARLGIKGSGTTISTVSLYIINSSSVGNFLVYDNGAINTGTTSAGSPYNDTTGTAANANLGADGFLRRSTSSLRYKTDIQDATHGLTDLLKLRSVTYKGKNDGDIIFGGLIAEEVDAAGLNEFVQYAADGLPDALAYGNMISLCIKAIQEQQAMITALTNRITALEATP